MRLFNPFFFFFALLAACDDYDPPADGDGPANAAFSYQCTSTADAACANSASVALPALIAEHSEFSVSFASLAPPNEDQKVVATISVSADDIVSIDANRHLHAERAGIADVLAVEADGTVAGYTQITVHEVATLEVFGLEAPASTRVGASARVSAIPHDDSGVALAGSLAFEYRASDESVIAIARTKDDEASGTATVVARAPGTATLFVSTGNTVTTIAITVIGIEGAS